jgi:hypothetical protein
MREIFRHLSNLPKIKNIIILLYLVKAVLSGLLIVPIFLSNNAILGSSSISRSLLEDWDMSVILELFSGRSEVALIYLLYIICGGLVYLLMMQFLNGGIYYLAVSGRFPRHEKNEFFNECGYNFINNLKISGIMIMVYLILFPAGMFLTNMAGIFIGDGSGLSIILATMLKLGIMAIVFLLASIFSDTARAAVAANPEKSVGDIVRTAAMFYRTNFLRLLGAYFTTYLPFLLIWGIVEILAIQTTRIPTGIAGVLFEFALFQVAALARTIQKLWYLLYLGKEYKIYNPGRFTPEQAELELR